MFLLALVSLLVCLQDYVKKNTLAVFTKIGEKWQMGH